MPTIKQRCDEIGISLPTYYSRIKNGMTPEEALSTPNKRHSPKSPKTPQPLPEPDDQEPRAPMMVKCGGRTSCVFEEDFQKRYANSEWASMRPPLLLNVRKKNKATQLCRRIRRPLSYNSK